MEKEIVKFQQSVGVPEKENGELVRKKYLSEYSKNSM